MNTQILKENLITMIADLSAQLYMEAWKGERFADEEKIQFIEDQKIILEEQLFELTFPEVWRQS
jgi:hypothetical protein